MLVCPTGAIKEKPKEIGFADFGTANGVKFGQGQLATVGSKFKYGKQVSGGSTWQGIKAMFGGTPTAAAGVDAAAIQAQITARGAQTAARNAKIMKTKYINLRSAILGAVNNKIIIND